MTEPTQAELNSACLSYRHDFGLLSNAEQARVRFHAREWLRAWQKEPIWNRRTVSVQEAARVLFAAMNSPNEVPEHVIEAGAAGDPLGGDLEPQDWRAVYSGALLGMLRALAEGERG